MQHFTVLDSLRGLCACFVVLYHFHAYSHIDGLPFRQNSYLFVDFFFVLSGFVISSNYLEKLKGGFSITKFMLLRFARLYPLHLFMLGCYILFEFILAAIPSLGAMSSNGVFQEERNSIYAIISNLFLVQSLGIHNTSTWNVPSWSISTEFYTYLAFALSLLFFRKRPWIPIIAALTIFPLVIASFSKENMNTTYDFGFLRCLYGFAAGVGCHYFYRKFDLKEKPLSKIMGNLLEFFSVIAVLGFVSLAGRDDLSVAAPYIFAIAILSFAQERGLISRFLQSRFLIFLGKISYSIYLVHFFIKDRIWNLGQLIEKFSSFKVFHRISINGEMKVDFGRELWQGDLLYLSFLLLIISVSYFTYHWIELPGQKWVEKFASRYIRGIAQAPAIKPRRKILPRYTKEIFHP